MKGECNMENKKGIFDLLLTGEGLRITDEVLNYDNESIMALVCTILDSREAEDPTFNSITALNTMLENVEVVHKEMGRMSI